MGDLVAEAVDHAAGQLDFEPVGPVALHQRRGAQEQHAPAVDPPGHPDAAGIALGPLDDQLVAADVGAAEPRQVVLAAHVNLFEPAGRNAISIVNH